MNQSIFRRRCIAFDFLNQNALNGASTIFIGRTFAARSRAISMVRAFSISPAKRWRNLNCPCRHLTSSAASWGFWTRLLPRWSRYAPTPKRIWLTLSDFSNSVSRNSSRNLERAAGIERPSATLLLRIRDRSEQDHSVASSCTANLLMKASQFSESTMPFPTNSDGQKAGSSRLKNIRN